MTNAEKRDLAVHLLTGDRPVPECRRRSDAFALYPPEEES
jgi:hypothetical protein